MKPTPLLLVLLVGCTSAEMSMGPRINPIVGGGSQWKGSGPIVDIAFRREGESKFCEYRHTSNLLSGWPFNGDDETTLDRVTCGVILRRK